MEPSTSGARARAASDSIQARTRSSPWTAHGVEASGQDDGAVGGHLGGGPGHQVVIDIYQADELFGESALLNLPYRCERATALENTKVMAWTTARSFE